jgi:hypothetical protein
MKRLVLILLLLMLTPITMAGDNPTHRPFVGTFSGLANFPFVDDCIGLTGVPFQTVAMMIGHMSHLGRTEFETAHCATPDGMYALYGEATMTAANGHEVTFTYTADTIAPPPLIVQAISMVVTGGTGRFEGASGELTGHVYINFLGIGVPDWPIEFVLSGWIVY